MINKQDILFSMLKGLIFGQCLSAGLSKEKAEEQLIKWDKLWEDK